MQFGKRWSGTYGWRSHLLIRNLLPRFQQRSQQTRGLFEFRVRLLTVAKYDLLRNIVVQIRKTAAQKPPCPAVQAQRQLRHRVIGPVHRAHPPGNVVSGQASPCLPDAVDRTTVKKGYELQRRGSCRRVLHVLLVRVRHNLSTVLIVRNTAIFEKFPLAAALLLALSLHAAEPADAQRSAMFKQAEAARRQSRPLPGGSFFTTEWLDTRQPAAAEAAPAGCDPLPEAELQSLIAAAAREHGVNPALIRAIIRRESAAVPCAVSPKGAQGLMQLMPSVQSRFGVTEPFDPAANVMAGTRYLKELLDRYKGNVSLVLAAYNAGPQRVDDAGGKVPDIAETKAYVAAVLAELERSGDPGRI